MRCIVSTGLLYCGLALGSLSPALAAETCATESGLVPDGTEAVELASQTLATLVLLDLRMPRMSGIEACLQIRQLPRYATVPIVILTVFDGETLKRRALTAGATSFLAKPFSRMQLLQIVNPLIEAQKRRLELDRF